MRTRLVSVLLLLATSTLVPACDKPDADECKRAIANLNKVHGVEMEPERVASAERKCQASSSKASVECMIAATTKEQAEACKDK